MYDSLLAGDLDSRRAEPFFSIRFITHFFLRSSALPLQGRVGGTKCIYSTHKETNLACLLACLLP